MNARRVLVGLSVALLFVGCSASTDMPSSTEDGGSVSDDLAEAPQDAEDDDADDVEAPPSDASAGEAPDEPARDAGADAPPAEWTRSYPLAEAMPAPDGYRWQRAIVHLHSTHSHDACDDQPRPGGDYNEPCLRSLRAALCDVRIDVAYLTDHPTHMDETPFVDLLLHDPALDELVVGMDGRPVGNWIDCGDGYRVLIRAGSEASLMPLALDGHVADDQPARHAILTADDEASIAAMRAEGALLWVAHTETKTAEWLERVRPDGIEIYQLHANIAPDLREDYLGLDPFEPIEVLGPFLTGTARAHPDLSILGFLSENEPALRAWARLAEDGRVVGTAGTDAHENTFPVPGRDGERLDSYRRMISWFSNYLLVAGDDPDDFDEALASGRVVIAFDVLGAPVGFDVAVRSGGARLEVGSDALWSSDAALHVSVPALRGPTGIDAELEARLLRAEDGDWTTVETWGAGDHEIGLDRPGVYRVQVDVTGAHLAPLLHDLAALAGRTYPWIYTNTFSLRSPG